jgi:nucleotidyltransferase substrate binding protein (TIGR01987 family)
VIELFWKCYKYILNNKGMVVTTPRDAIASAFQAHWINDEAMWISMLKDRNLSSHTYNEKLANDILGRIPLYMKVLEESYRELPLRANMVLELKNDHA